ncbi:MAG: AAA family ATPase, partial [Thermomicrobiales bacterium]
MANHDAGHPQPEARLTRLELHGFKSFATRTVFRFDRGITAVVGPNGSGKSNIADAVRWVLGETSYNALRSKKTEDVIFAGGRGKAPAGLAEVTVVFNNDDHWLPSEFTEVSVTRRAYRGGDNQYLINGRRVRLKDIAFLTASLGQSYTVVGQGLVDAALSQRPEDRRGLFEHAADLAGLRLKVGDAERNLNEARSNTERLVDLLTDVEPRLKTLERAARQAREWQGLRDRLTRIQQHHYQRLLIDSTTRVAEVQQALDAALERVAQIRGSIESLMAQRTAANEAISEAQDSLGTHDARLEVLREQARRLSHERDIVEERQGALTRRRADMTDTAAALDDQVHSVETEERTLTAAIQMLDEQTEQSRRTVAHLQQTSQETRRLWGDREGEANDVQRAIVAAERALNDLVQRRALLEQRQETGLADAERLTQEARSRNARIAEIERDLAAQVGEDEANGIEAGVIQDHLERLQRDIEAIWLETDTIGREFRETETALAAARNRFDFLQRTHESGSGLSSGVRQVMQWQRDGQLSGILGTVAELVSIEARFDTAIEVALGGHLQDVVVDRWQDADIAISRLKQSKSGRATFQPLDTVGRYGSQRPVPQELKGRRGVHGLAADLVTAKPGVEPVVRSLLGRFVVAEDLETARDLLAVLPGGWSAVTLSGEIARSSGSVTGGAAVR